MEPWKQAGIGIPAVILLSKIFGLNTFFGLGSFIIVWYWTNRDEINRKSIEKWKKEEKQISVNSK